MGKIAKIVDVSGSSTIQDMLEKSETDFSCQIVPAHVGIGDGYTDTGGYRAIVRPDLGGPYGTAIGMVGKNYKVNDHRAQLHTLDDMAQRGVIVPVSVSIWDDGSILAYQFRCPDLDVTIFDRDIVSPLLTLAFSYGGKLSDTAFFSDFRWFCKNQLGKVAKLSRGYRVPHKGEVISNFADMLGKRLTELSGDLAGRYDSMRRMVTSKLTGKALPEYVGEVIGASKDDIEQAWFGIPEDLTGPSRRIVDVLDCYQADDCNAPGSVWQAYNAVTRHMSHKFGRTEATRQKNMLLGPGSDVAEKAWEVAARLAA